MNIAFLPIRGGSKSIKYKNIKIMCGLPLFTWAMMAAEECPLISKVIIGTDSDQIWDVAQNYISEKISMYDTGPMGDTCLQEDVMVPLAEKVNFDKIVLLQATQPLVTTENLTSALDRMRKEKLDSMISVCRQHRFIWDQNGPVNYDPQKRPRRQEWDGLLIENGAFFITTHDALLKSKCRVSGNIGTFIMKPYTFFDIDEPEDWGIMEMLLEKQILGEFLNE
jgi:N-acylneuraminate cytidylyltransferase